MGEKSGTRTFQQCPLMHSAKGRPKLRIQQLDPHPKQKIYLRALCILIVTKAKTKLKPGSLILGHETNLHKLKKKKIKKPEITQNMLSDLNEIKLKISNRISGKFQNDWT